MILKVIYVKTEPLYANRMNLGYNRYSLDLTGLVYPTHTPTVNLFQVEDTSLYGSWDRIIEKTLRSIIKCFSTCI